MFSLPWWISLTVGFLSLSVEILWVRLIGFAYSNQPQAFSFVLACYLIGIAAGAAVGKRYCESEKDLYFVAAITLLIAGFFDIFSPSLAAEIYDVDHQCYTLVRLIPLVLGSAAIKSVLFPIAHHLGSNQQGAEIGRSVSKVYFGNIIGSTLGPLFTGFWLLDTFNLDECFILIGSVSFLLASLCTLKVLKPIKIVAGVAAGMLAVIFLWNNGGIDSLQKLATSSLWLKQEEKLAISNMNQNKHGVIHILKALDSGGDVVFGGNVYDGRINVNTEVNSNRLDRIYMAWLLRPKPKRILVVGLSTGAWVRVLQSFPGVERIDVVEINPGYINIIKDYPEVSPVLSDPRIHIHIDDGRRWLKRHAELKYDLIVQNTSYYWRAYATNVLSKDYFTEVKSHMSPGALLATNTTYSYDVFATANAIFPYAYKYSNFVYASDRPLNLNKANIASDLALMSAIGNNSISPSQNKESVISRLINLDFLPVSSLLSVGSGKDAGIITDQNMLGEYRHGCRICPRLLNLFLPPVMPTVPPDLKPLQ